MTPCTREGCRVTFHLTRPNRRFCSLRCKQAHRRGVPAFDTERPCACGCRRPVRPVRRCHRFASPLCRWAARNRRLHGLTPATLAAHAPATPRAVSEHGGRS